MVGNKEIIVTLSDDTKHLVNLTRSRKTDKWQIELKDVEGDSKKGILDFTELDRMIDEASDVYNIDGIALINRKWIIALKQKISSLKSGAEVPPTYIDFVQEFSDYMENVDPLNEQMVQTIQIMSPILMKIVETETNNNCKLG